MNDENRQDIIFENLARLDKRQLSLNECRYAHLTELERLISENAEAEALIYGDDALRQRYRDITGLRYEEAITGIDEALPDNAGYIRCAFRELNYSDRVYLCSLIARKMGNNDKTAAGLFFSGSDESGENLISYLKNSYTDIAYRNFGKVIKDPKVTYGYDFSDVCEDVYYNRAKFCIVPVENNTDGMLSGFRKLIMKYDLKTVLTCEVVTSDSGDSTRFALLKKNIDIIDCAEYGGGRFFELSLPLSVNITLAQLLSAAESFGLRLSKIDSLPIAYSDHDFLFNMVFAVDGSDFPGFLCYLNLEAPQFTPVGVYTHIKPE